MISFGVRIDGTGISTIVFVRKQFWVIIICCDGRECYYGRQLLNGSACSTL